tara:strand:- start:430 stop:1215 length:786 start_codon:yes stop_codon:yes gene_type:complete
MKLGNIISLLGILCLSGCGYFQSEASRDREEMDWPEERLYKMAKDRLDSGSCTGAIEYYEKLQARFPFGDYTQKAQMELAYCYFRTDDPFLAIETLDRFIKLYPTHEKIDYAFYLRGLINFGRGWGFTERFVRKDESQRDPGASLDSFNDFSKVVKSYPESEHAEDSRLRMVYLRNMLAQHEVNVANYYMRRGAYVAASNRARYVLEKYQKAPVMPEALVILAKAYTVLEMTDLAEDVISTLSLNYPNHIGLKELNDITLK